METQIIKKIICLALCISCCAVVEHTSYTQIDSKVDSVIVPTDTDSNASWSLRRVKPTCDYNAENQTLSITLHNIKVLCCNDCDLHKRKYAIGSFLNPAYFNSDTVPTEPFEPGGISPICRIYKSYSRKREARPDSIR